MVRFLSNTEHESTRNKSGLLFDPTPLPFRSQTTIIFPRISLCNENLYKKPIQIWDN